MHIFEVAQIWGHIVPKLRAFEILSLTIQWEYFKCPLRVFQMPVIFVGSHNGAQKKSRFWVCPFTEFPNEGERENNRKMEAKLNNTKSGK